MPTTDLTAMLSPAASTRPTPAVFDSLDYAQAVLIQGREVPWENPLELASLLDQAQSLMHSNAIVFDLGAFVAHRLKTDLRLRQRLAERSRPGYAFKTLAGDDALRADAAGLASIIAKTAGAPLIIRLPSPRVWLGVAHQAAGHDDAAALTADMVENYAAYYANWLHGLETVPFAALLIDDRWQGSDDAPELGDPHRWTPVFNVADHNRWLLLLHDHDGGLGLLTADGTAEASARAQVVADAYWASPDAQPDRLADGESFRFSHVPIDAVPETVLAQLAKLDGSV